MAGRRKTVKVLVKQHWADTPHIRKRCNHVEGSVSEELEEEVEDKTNYAHQPHQQENNHPCYKRKYMLYTIPNTIPDHPGNEASEQPTPYKVSYLVT